MMIPRLGHYPRNVGGVCEHRALSGLAGSERDLAFPEHGDQFPRIAQVRQGIGNVSPMGFRRSLLAFLRGDGSPIGLDGLPATYRQVSQVPTFLFRLSLAELFSSDLRLRQCHAQMRDLRLEFLSGHRIQGRFRCWHRMIVIAIHIRGDGGAAIEKMLRIGALTRGDREAWLGNAVYFDTSTNLII